MCVEKTVQDPFLHLVRVRNFCVELRAEQDLLVADCTLISVAGLTNHLFLWLMPSLHFASLILNSQDRAISGFVSVSFH